MSCTTIELKRKAVTGLEEIGKKIQEDLSGDFVSSELAVRKITEAEGVLFHSGKEGDIREQLIKSDLIEAVVALAGGVFYGTGVSACILFLNNNKRPEHKGKVCLIDATSIYTPKRAQNVMEEKDINEVIKLYQDYKDVIEKCKIVSISDLDAEGNTLAVNTYIEKKKQEVVAPEIVRAQYFEALENVKKAEAKMKKLLIEGGYVDEQ